MDRISNWNAYPWNSISSPMAPNRSTTDIKRMLTKRCSTLGAGSKCATRSATRNDDDRHTRRGCERSADEEFAAGVREPAEAEIGKTAAFVNSDHDCVRDGCGGERRERGSDDETSQRINYPREQLHSHVADQDKETDAQQNAGDVFFLRGGHLVILTRTPWRATRAGRIVAPSVRIIFSTRSRVSGSIKNNTQPPPPPHRLRGGRSGAASFRNQAIDQRSRNAGTLVRRCDHSSRINLATSFQS